MTLSLITHATHAASVPAPAPWQDGARNPIAPFGCATLANLVALLDAPLAPTDRSSAHEPMRLWRVRSGATLFHAGATSPWLYVVRTGAFKSVRPAEDGYQQVLSMLLPGDMMGFEVLCCEQQPVSAVALEDSTVFALTVDELAALGQRLPAFNRAVQRALARQLLRCAELAEVMAAVAAEARVARFVLWLSARMAARGESASHLRLRLCRRDVASLLGVAHETVSRALSTLDSSGCLRVDNRDLEIIDRPQLQARARHTRGLLDEGPAPSPTGRQAQACAAA